MFLCFRVMRTSFTNDLVREYSTKHIFDKSGTISTSHLIFKSVEKYIGKLVYIHLFCYISWISFIIFKGMTEILRSIKFLITDPEIKEHFLNLIKEILAVCFFDKIRLFTTCKSVSKTRNHKELLHEAVHVADTS